MPLSLVCRFLAQGATPSIALAPAIRKRKSRKRVLPSPARSYLVNYFSFGEGSA
jgi:hypothetical protein